MLINVRGEKSKIIDRQIIFDLLQPDGIVSHIKNWIPAYTANEPELSGAIQDQVIVSVKNGKDSCSFESVLIHVIIDSRQNRKLIEVFIASEAMNLEDSVSIMKKMLTMLGEEPAKLDEWTKGAIAWTKNPLAWPKDILIPLDDPFRQGIKLKGKDYWLEIRTSRSDEFPWKVTLRVNLPEKV